MAPIPGSGPTTADWLGAWSAFGAALGTVGAFFTGVSLWWRDRRRIRRAQARLVHGYISNTGQGLAVAQGSYQVSVRAAPKYVILNASDEPIYQVTVPHLTGGDTVYGLILAGETREKPMSEKDAEKFRREHTESSVPMAFSFADSSSARWKRNKKGRLSGGWRYTWPRKK